MKTTHSTRSRSSFRILAGSIAALLAVHGAAPAVRAGDVIWDITPGVVGPGNGTISGGLGLWDTTLGNWTVDGGANNIAWDNGANDTAVFGGAAGIVTLGTPITVGGLTFNDNAGYLLALDLLTFGTAATITANVSAQIDSIVDGQFNDLTFAGAGNMTVTDSITNTTTLTKTGAGSLTLAANAFTSATIDGGTIAGGLLTLTNGSTALTSNGTSAISADVLLPTAPAQITSNAGTLTLGGTIDADSHGLTFAGAGGTTISNAISNLTALSKTGTGTLTLAGANSHAGTTTISAGVLNIQHGTALGTAANGTSVANGAALQTQGGITVGAEALTLNGTGVAGDGALRNISGANVWQGAVTLGNAVRINSDAGSLTFNTAATSITAANQNLTLGGAGDGTVAGLIATGNGTLTKDGTGTWTLAGANTYTGATAINAGTLRLGSGGSGANTPLGTTSAGTTVTATSAALDLNGFTLTTAEALTLNGSGISNGGALTNSGAAATYSGLITLGSSSSIIAGSGNIVLSNSGTITGAGFSLTLGGSGPASSLASVIATGTGTLTKTGLGTWALTNANTFSGDTLVSAGVLTLSHNQALQNSVLDTSGAGTLTATTSTPTFGGLKGSANLASVITSGYGSVTALTLQPAGGVTLTYSGAIANGTAGMTLTKSGAGTQTLSGPSTYTGATTVNAGTLILAGNNVAATGDITVNTGGMVQFIGTTSINGGAHNVLNRDVTVNAGGTVAFGPAFGAGAADVALALANRLVASSAGTIAADNYAGAAFNFVAAGLTTASLGAVGTVSYTGLHTPNGTTYRLGGGGGILNYGSAITGAGNSLLVSGAGTVGLSLANSYGAGSTVSGGTLLLSAAGTLGSTTAPLAISGGTLDLGGSSQTVGAVTVSSGAIQNGTLSGTSFAFSGGTISVNLLGSGTITSTGNPTTLNGNNSGFSGPINVTSNTLKAIDPRSLGTGLVTLSANTTLSLVNDGSGTGTGNGKPETLNYAAAVALAGNATISVDRLTASGSGTVVNAQNKTMRLGTLSIGSLTLTVGNNNGFGLEFSGTTTLTAAPTFNVGGGSNAPVVQGLTFAGQVAGAFGFTKSGGGTLVLTNATSSFGAASTINITGGLLSVTSNGALGNAGNIISLNGGGLQASGTFSTARRVNTTVAGGVIDVTQGSTPGSLTMLTLTAAFNGGVASVNGLTKNGNGILEINADNIGGTPYTGVFTINGGAVRISNAGALGAAANNTVVANNVGAALQINGVATSELITINSTGLNSGGAIENVAGNGAVNGAITLASAATIGSTAGTLDIGGAIAGAFGLTFSGAATINLNNALNSNVTGITKIGSGTTTIAVNNSGNSANITVNAGTFQIGSNATGLGKTNGALTVNPGATLKVDNSFASDNDRLSGKGVTLAGATFAFTGNAGTNTTESAGGLSFGVGQSTVMSTYTGSDTLLSFSSIGVRPLGGTRNFSVVGGVNGTTNQIVLGGQAEGYIDHGSFFGGNAYVCMDAFGTFLRGGVYGSDAGFDTSVATVSLASATHQEITGAVTAQNTETFTTFKVSGNHSLTLAPGQTVTLNGLLKAGNVAGGATISGGNGIKAANNAEMVIRTDGANDLLTISTPILAQGTNALTKTGLGTLVLSGANTYTGQTTVNQGTLTLSGGNYRLATGNPLVVNQGGVLSLGSNNQYVGNLSSTGPVQDAGGIVTATGGTLTVNQTTAGTFAGSLQGSVNLIKAGGQTLTLTSANTTTGTIAVIGGLVSIRERNNSGDLGFGLFLKDGGTLANTTGITVRNSTLNIDNTGTKDLPDRISDTAPIALDNGTIRFVGRLQTNSTETIGPVTASGFASITMLVAGNANGQTGQASATLTLTSLARASGGLIHFNRSGGVSTPLGRLGNNPRVLLLNDDTSGLTFSNDTVVGMFTNNDNDKMMPVSYVPGLGFGNMGQTGFPNRYMTGADGNGFTGQNTLASAGPSNDFNTGASQVVKAGGQTVNSLGIQGAGQGVSNTSAVPLTFQAPGDTLTLASGWLGLWFRRNVLGDTVNRGAITSGQSELFLLGDYLGALGSDNVNTIHSVIKNNGTSPVKFVMSLARDTYLTADNTYTGGTVVNGVLGREGGGTYLSTLFLDGTVAGYRTIPKATNAADGLVINSSNVTMLTNAGQIHPDNIVTLNGSSVLTLTGNNTLAGLVFNSNGGTATPTVAPVGALTLTGNISANPSNAAVTPTISGGLLNFAGATRTITVGALPEGDFASFTGLHISSAIQNGGLTKKGLGTLTLSGTNSFGDQLTVENGVLRVATVNNADTNGVFGNSSLPVILGGTGGQSGTLEYSGSTATTDKPLTLATGGAGGVNVTGAGTELTLSGLIAGAGSLTKTGAGTLNLDNPAQSYDALAANAGTTNLNGTLGTAPGVAFVTVSNPGTKLKFGSVSQTLQSLTIGAGATVVFTSDFAAGSFSGGGSVGKAPGSAVVPEPGSLGLLLVGVLGVLGRRRRG